MAIKFKAVLKEPDILKESINTVANLLNEGVFNLTKTGIELKSMDSANVAMVELKLLASAFTEFEVKENTKISLNMNDLTSVLKRTKSDDILTLKLEGNALNLEFAGSVNRKFEVPLLDIRDESKSPSLEFPATVEVKTSVIEDGISDAEIISDAVVLEMDPDSFVMRAEGDSRKAEMRLEKGSDALISLKAKDHVKSTFPLDYMRKMIKGSKMANTAILHMGNDYPMKLEFKVIDKALLSFILAPRIENE
ncbi:MAG: proliferating cell nuclear antigen (pcna) [archaeon]